MHSAKLVKQRILSDVEENDIILMHDASELYSQKWRQRWVSLIHW
ncbi:MAG: hypothetical protein V8R80_06865 [Eubacterium sp.]